MSSAIRTIHSEHHHFGWDRSLPPVMEVASGDTIEFGIVDASGGQLNPRSTAADVATLDFAKVNPVTGPVYVKGAQPGDVLEVEIREFRHTSWGWTAIIPGFGLLADEFPQPWLYNWEIGATEAVFNDRIRIPVRAFPGTIGVAPKELGNHSIVPPRPCGGNMDIRHLVAGAKLYLPVQVEGALFSVGDTHAAQGDGEVCGTAIETPMQVALTFRLQRNRKLQTPAYETPGPLGLDGPNQRFYATTGISPDLMQAARQAVRHMIEHLMDSYRLSEQEAYALCSVAVDLKISEVVDAPNWLVSACLPLSVMRG